MKGRYHGKSRLPGPLAAAALRGASPSSRACLHPDQAGEDYSVLLAGDYPRTLCEASAEDLGNRRERGVDLKGVGEMLQRCEDVKPSNTLKCVRKTERKE